MVFTASNGVELTEYGYYAGGDLRHKADVHAARIEFYRHLEDERLGRWRWPENPDYVVYPVASEHAVVWDERRREPWYVHLDIAQAESVRTARDAFRAYLAAHHEPKPWHDAKPGEVWVVKEQGQPERAYLVDGSQFYDSSRDYALYFEDSVILEARRVWPEVS